MMEHYVLCAWNGPFSEEDHVFVTNYLNALFPNALQYQHIALFSEETALLLKPTAKYISVVNTDQENEKSQWECIKEDISVIDIITKLNANKTKSEFPSNDNTEQMSASFHSLADQFPAFGTYKLDVILGSDVLKELSVSKEPVLAAAFIRLTRWHSAHFTIFEQEQFDIDKLNEWCEILNADILKNNCNLVLGPSLWRGSVIDNVADQTPYQGFELKLITETSLAVSNIIKENNCQTFLEHHIALSSKLQVIDKVSFNSIPPYLISPIVFRLHLGKLNIFNGNSLKFINHHLNNNEAALIMRLDFAEMEKNIKPEKKYCTNAWQKAVSSGNLRDPKCFVSTFEKFITFAATKSKVSGDILVYPLREKSLEANFYFNIVNYRVSNLPYEISDEKSKHIDKKLLTGVPLIDCNLFEEILSHYANQKVKHLKNGSVLTSAKDNSDLTSLIESVKNSATCSVIREDSVCDMLLEETDPSDWPERIQLLQKQMKKTKEIATINASGGQNLKFPHLTFSFSTDLIRQYFLSSGEIKNSARVKKVHSLKNTDQPISCDLGVVLHSKWPETINCVYHDIYYNINYQAEDKENLGSQMVNLYVQQETASISNNNQIAQNFSLVVHEKSSTPSKEFRSPSTRAANNLGRRHQEYCNSPKGNSLKELISKKILFASKAQHIENTAAMTKSVGGSKKILNKTSVAVRCSPRKKNHVNYTYPSIKRNVSSNKNGNIHDSNKVSDMLRKKIRFAVTTALENNGINMDHAIFKSCGTKLFSICLTFLDGLASKKTKTSEYLQKIADAHVKQVIDHYKD